MFSGGGIIHPPENICQEDMHLPVVCLSFAESIHRAGCRVSCTRVALTGQRSCIGNAEMEIRYG